MSNGAAFGAPGIEPRWASSAKEGLGTAYNTSCRLWFTLSHGIVNEIYYPHIDQPNTRDFQLLVTDGKTFCHEEKRDLEHRIEFPHKGCAYYRLINTDPKGRYRLVKHLLADPHQSVFLMHTRLEILDPALQGTLKVYALLAPHLAGNGAGNAAYSLELAGFKLLRAERAGTHLVLGCKPGFVRGSVGYVGFSDGWQDLMAHRSMDWEFDEARDGNVALTGEVDLGATGEFTLGVALGAGAQEAAVKLLQSLAEPFEGLQEDYVRQWRATAAAPDFDFAAQTYDGGHLYRLSRCLLMAHEDKNFQGALVASMSIPWGETKNDSDQGGYHLVWTRDLVQSACALLAAGHPGTPLRSLIWLAATQQPDGSFPQNSWINGTAYWSGLQLDEVAAPILLVWRLEREGGDLDRFDPSAMLLRATAYLVRQGPVTAQERWEETAGYSPSTLATVVAGLVCAADFLGRRGVAAAPFILDYADWMAAHIEDWCVARHGALLDGVPRHYIRVNPTDAVAPDPHADPDRAILLIGNGGGVHPAKDVVGGDFLHLVRLGIRAADDPLVLDTLKVLDHALKVELPQGFGWRRYNHDGYGQKDDGGAYDGTGVGRVWPILTGERGHYELAAGRDPGPYLRAMEAYANSGGMLSEQLWDGPAMPEKELAPGGPTGAAMPLCWSHAEYIALVRSAHDGVCFDRVEPAYQRYVAHPRPHSHEMWSPRHPIRWMPAGKGLRLVLPAAAVVVWTSDDWAGTHKMDALPVAELGLWFADLPAQQAAAGTVFEFTLYWPGEQRWEGGNRRVEVR